MTDFDGRTGTITTLSPIRPDRLQELYETLRGMEGHSPFCDLERTRFARWAIVPRSWPPQAPRASLRSDYLLWIATFDGPPDRYLTELANPQGERARTPWRCCVGWPSTEHPDAVIAYLRQARVPVDLFLAFHSDVTLDEIRQAVVLQKILRELVQEAQDLSKEALMARYAEAMGRE